ncbi:hypothetical protein EYC84_005747 [Monilinia fructicola]|uniref:Uncharacterized protein n=1 Tax=Monilinia fructicola TaxID=38448 RepID=A0A5M9K022_MONFR|nr:hypothetical protein EYC84_005747 [Monilinia fructicola]
MLFRQLPLGPRFIKVSHNLGSVNLSNPVISLPRATSLATILAALIQSFTPTPVYEFPATANLPLYPLNNS